LSLGEGELVFGEGEQGARAGGGVAQGVDAALELAHAGGEEVHAQDDFGAALSAEVFEEPLAHVGLVAREGGFRDGQPAVLPFVEGRDELGAARGLAAVGRRAVFGERAK
jgi:hypothetical protein